MDIENSAVKYLIQKVNSDEKLDSNQIKKWISVLPKEIKSEIFRNVSDANKISKDEVKRVLNYIKNGIGSPLVQKPIITTGPKKKKVPTKFKKGDVLMHPIFRHPYVLLEKKSGSWVCGLLTSEPKCPNILEKTESRFFVEEYFTRVMFIETATPPGTYMYPFENNKQLKSVLQKLKQIFK